MELTVRSDELCYFLFNIFVFFLFFFSFLFYYICWFIVCCITATVNRRLPRERSAVRSGRGGLAYRATRYSYQLSARVQCGVDTDRDVAKRRRRRINIARHDATPPHRMSASTSPSGVGQSSASSRLLEVFHLGSAD